MESNHDFYPMTFTPVLKGYVWGGRNLEQLFKRPLPPGITAESWEIAAHKDGTTTVQNGQYAGKPLTALQEMLGLDLIGYKSAWAQERNKFPLLIKVLDAQANLSVQVHPGDDYAQSYEGNELGKTEMWVVLHAEPEAAVILGVKPGTNIDNFRQAITDNTAKQHLHSLPVKTGDVVCVPSGSLHAILGGSVLAEIQQNSNTTYRVYDWGRPRPLHIDHALAVSNFDQVEPGLAEPWLIKSENGMSRYRLCHNQYFTTERVEIEAGAIFSGECDGSTFEIWGAISGAAALCSHNTILPLLPIRFALLPAAMGAFSVTVQEDTTLLRSYVK